MAIEKRPAGPAPAQRPLILLAIALSVLAEILFAPPLAADPAVQGTEKTVSELRVKLVDGLLVLRPLSDNVVRVRYSDGRTVENPSFVLTQKLTPPKFEVSEEGNTIRLTLKKVQVVVDRESGAVTFLDAAGSVLLQEPAHGGKKLTPETVDGARPYCVEQKFLCPPDEVLYGLGQFQDGIWNWRGIPLELRQVNTQIAIPMLISSKGYGLLWDNASLTDFNPTDQEIPLQDGPVQDADHQSNAQEDLAKTPLHPGRALQKNGNFTTGEAGEYVFFAKDGDRRNDFAILVDGKQVAGVTNMWTPAALSAKVTLPARATIAVALRGGGENARLFARPLGDTTTFRSQVGEAIDYTFFYGPSLDKVVAGYREATGTAPLWPKWAYGFWQCRERYSSQQQILDVITEFRRRGIPIDLIIQDWQYWGPNGWGAYQWDTKNYPEPEKMLKGIHDQNARFMLSVWCNPHGKIGEDFQRKGLLIGPWIDVFNPEARELRWSYLNEAFFKIGVDAWWGDCTEPGDDSKSIAGKMTGSGPGDRLLNSYPLFASQSLYEGQRAADPGKRVCILTRSSYLGMQRYAAAAWSGDINGDWTTFKRQIPAGLNYCVAGLPYWTTDCGGFFHPRDQYTSADYNELLTRWFEWSTFCPIMRVHGYKTETEMWKWLPETQKIMLAYDQFRYRLLPYNYSVAWSVTNEDRTMMRPLAMDFPQDPQALVVPDEYMFGPAFLVAPVTDPVSQSEASHRVYLPAGSEWVNFWTGDRCAGGRQVATPAPLDTLPLYVRAGSIVPLGPVVQYANEKPDAPYEIRVYRGASGSFTIYEDEGDNYNYEKGAHASIPLLWDEGKQTLTIGERIGEFHGMARAREFRIGWVSANHGTGAQPLERPDAVIEYTGQPITVHAD